MIPQRHCLCVNFLLIPILSTVFDSAILFCQILVYSLAVYHWNCSIFSQIDLTVKDFAPLLRNETTTENLVVLSKDVGQARKLVNWLQMHIVSDVEMHFFSGRALSALLCPSLPCRHTLQLENWIWAVAGQSFATASTAAHPHFRYSSCFAANVTRDVTCVCTFKEPQRKKPWPTVTDDIFLH